jgi:hypothetical protein
VYCLEEVDNGSLLSQIYVDENAKVQEAPPVKELPGKVPTLCYSGIRLENSQKEPGRLYDVLQLKKTKVQLKAIPYCLWNNRGEGEMTVWQKVRI